MPHPWRYVHAEPAKTLEQLRRSVDRNLHSLEQMYNHGIHTYTKTADYTATSLDQVLFVDATAGNVTISLPPAAKSTRWELRVRKIDGSANSVTIDGYGSETIDGAATQSTTTQYAGWTIVSDGSNWFTV